MPTGMWLSGSASSIIIQPEAIESWYYSSVFVVKVYSFIQYAVQSTWRSSVLPIRNLCYTGVSNMQMDSVSETRSTWLNWAEFLRRYGLENLVAWALEAAGPLTVLAAQALYIGGPLLRPVMTDLQRDALAGLLEDHDEALAFRTFLREEKTL
jgi:hypothetical protein